MQKKRSVITKLDLLQKDFDTIRAILSIAAKEHLQLAQFDVKTAFLNGVLTVEI